MLTPGHREARWLCAKSCGLVTLSPAFPLQEAEPWWREQGYRGQPWSQRTGAACADTGGGGDSGPTLRGVQS